jgi:hypothetical protein
MTKAELKAHREFMRFLRRMKRETDKWPASVKNSALHLFDRTSEGLSYYPGAERGHADNRRE